MKVVLTKALKVSPNGYEVITYQAGEQELEGTALAAAQAQGIVKKEEKQVAPKAIAKKKTKVVK